RRLKEAERLAMEGRLDANVSRNLGKKFEQHAEASLALAEATEDIEMKAEVHADLEATLEAHKTALAALVDTSEELENVRAIVHAKAELSEDARRAVEQEHLSATTTDYSLAVIEKRKE